MKIENGDIAHIPFLGSLTPLIPLLSAADAAHAHFTAAKGVIHTDDLHISSETLALIGNGNYDFVTDQTRSGHARECQWTGGHTALSP